MFVARAAATHYYDLTDNLTEDDDDNDDATMLPEDAIPSMPELDIESLLQVGFSVLAEARHQQVPPEERRMLLQSAIFEALYAQVDLPDLVPPETLDWYDITEHDTDQHLKAVRLKEAGAR